MTAMATEVKAYRDEFGDLWVPLPEAARWNTHEGAFLVDGEPVMVAGGTHYLVVDADDDDSRAPLQT